MLHPLLFIALQSLLPPVKAGVEGSPHYMHASPDTEWMCKLQWLVKHLGLGPGFSHPTFSTFLHEAA